MAPRGFILTFHSHNVAGDDYANNDHVALDATLALLRRRRIPVLRLLEVVRNMRERRFAELPERFACITFDDGSQYDWRDLDFPGHGRQDSMYSVLRRHSRRLLNLLWLRRVHATTFVIASAQARREIAAAALGDANLMTDDWWRDAQYSGFMDIGSHGWNHVHPAVSEMSGRPELVERFDLIDRAPDAQLHIDRAFEAIQEVAGGDAGRIFAYPYGQVSEYIAGVFLPAQRRVLAAVTTEPRPLEAGTSLWRLPRYMCGPDWSSDAGLERVLDGG